MKTGRAESDDGYEDGVFGGMKNDGSYEDGDPEGPIPVTLDAPEAWGEGQGGRLIIHRHLDTSGGLLTTLH